MARKVFFSFHFTRDSWRVSQVRNSQTIRGAYDETQFLDAAHWEQVKRQGDQAIRNWIDNQLRGTSCTIVLIGNETSDRRWVKYEIQKSWDKGNGLIGIYIHNLIDRRGSTDLQGDNPFNQFDLKNKFSNRYYPRTYNWVSDYGRTNAATWIEQAIKDREWL